MERQSAVGAEDPGSCGGEWNLDVTPGLWFFNTALQPCSILTDPKWKEFFGLSLAGMETDMKSGDGVSM